MSAFRNPIVGRDSPKGFAPKMSYRQRRETSEAFAPYKTPCRRVK
jgi:hypothetical protein